MRPCTFSCLSELLEHFENKCLVGGDSGKVFTWNSALAVYTFVGKC